MTPKKYKKKLSIEPEESALHVALDSGVAKSLQVLGLENEVSKLKEELRHAKADLLDAQDEMDQLCDDLAVMDREVEIYRDLLHDQITRRACAEANDDQ